jgi:hypothetical protein
MLGDVSMNKNNSNVALVMVVPVLHQYVMGVVILTQKQVFAIVFLIGVVGIAV